MSRKTVSDVACELAVHQKESAERWKTAFNKFTDIELNIKDLNGKIDRGQTYIMLLLVGLLIYFLIY